MDKIKKIVSYLRTQYSQTFVNRCETPFCVLIFTLLSQRSRDVQTEKVTKELFNIFPDPKSLAKAKLSEIERIIKPIGFYKVKAERIKKIAQTIISEYGGVVPESKEELMALEGVGTKTANCVLVYAFNKPAIPVDIHVHRISNRIGIIKTKTPEQSEDELMRIVPKIYWIEINELMVKFGQNNCFPIKPRCSECGMTEICNFYKENKGTNNIK